MKKGLICLSTAAIIVFCTLNVATASTGNYSTTFYNNARHTEGILHSSPATPNGIVYIGSGDHNVYALNVDTGAKIWSYTTGSIVWSSPAVANGVVYVGSLDHNVYALDARTGAKIWSYTTGNWVLSSPSVPNGRLRREI